MAQQGLEVDKEYLTPAGFIIRILKIEGDKAEVWLTHQDVVREMKIEDILQLGGTCSICGGQKPQGWDKCVHCTNMDTFEPG